GLHQRAAPAPGGRRRLRSRTGLPADSRSGVTPGPLRDRGEARPAALTESRAAAPVNVAAAAPSGRYAVPVTGRGGGMADTEHSKCSARKGVRVRVPLPARTPRHGQP